TRRGCSKRQRISELEEKRDRLARERERLVGRSRALADLAIPAAHREATRITMDARLKEYTRQGGLDSTDLAEKSPALDPPARFDNELRELMVLSRKIAGRMEYLHLSRGALT